VCTSDAEVHYLILTLQLLESEIMYATTDLSWAHQLHSQGDGADSRTLF